MATMFRTPLTCLVFLLSIFNITTAQLDGSTHDALEPRQSPNANAANSPVCQNYALVANLSTVALNSTYRAAYMRSSPLGTFAARTILDVQKPKLMAMMMDPQLNQECGNLTQVAIDAAAVNLTNNVVLELAVQAAPGIETADPAMPILTVIIFIMMVVFTLGADVPVKEMIAEIAVPAVLVCNTVSLEEVPQIVGDADSPRVQEFIKQYDETSFKENNLSTGFGVSMYVRKP
ncbi:hypothetical protein F5B20DRAFT_584798 [Whalleya microplaca]|nr:hypothetical protein F5B20DRAFT_584798 [Whalleya microplaca]